MNKARGLGGCSPSICLHERFEKAYNNYLLETVLVDGTMFFKASLHGVKRKRGVGGGRSPPPPPFANTMSLSRVLRGSIWLLFLPAG